MYQKCVYGILREDLTSGWGIDLIWYKFCKEVAGFSRTAVYECLYYLEKPFIREGCFDESLTGVLPFVAASTSTPSTTTAIYDQLARNPAGIKLTWNWIFIWEGWKNLNLGVAKRPRLEKSQTPIVFFLKKVSSSNSNTRV
jgi:hypothetical protein